MFAWLRARRRRALLAQPMPPEWEAILARDVAHYPLLTGPQRATLRGCVNVLVAEFNWEGARGLIVTERMRVVVAAGVALLMLRDRHDYFRHVPSVILYPGAFRRPESVDELVPDEGELAGEAHEGGPVILSWPEARAEAADLALGQHLVIHEFAHQLDTLSGELNGAPPLPDSASVARWQAAFAPALDRHLVALGASDKTLFSPDAIDAVEFFADACEAFFAAPVELLTAEPAVYAELTRYFAVEPATWFAS